MKEYKEEIGKRIRKAVNYIVYKEDLINQRDVADLIGKDKDNLSKAFRGDAAYINTYIDAICAKYPNFNKEWFEIGEGNMLLSEIGTPIITTESTTEHDIKILDIRVCAGHGIGFEDKENKITGYVNIPEFSGCYGVTVYGDSMYDMYMPGDVIFVREVKDKKMIENGQPYVVITHEDRLLKMIHIDYQNKKTILSSYNNIKNPDGKRKYPDMEIDIDSDVIFLYKVVGKLARTQM